MYIARYLLIKCWPTPCIILSIYIIATAFQTTVPLHKDNSIESNQLFIKAYLIMELYSYIVDCLVLIFTSLHGNPAISIKYLFMRILFVVCSGM